MHSGKPLDFTTMQIEEKLLDEIRKHGQETYPEECCGFLLGTSGNAGNRVTATWRVKNRQQENRRRRYTITPADYLAADREARKSGLDIIGIYHSHPDHPAFPSATDLAEATFPGFTYVIVSIQQGKPAALTAWRLAPDRSQFDAEVIETKSSEQATKEYSNF